MSILGILLRRNGALFGMALALATAHAQVRLVNMIPPSWSADINQDSETTIAANPADPQQLVGSAFTWDNTAGATTWPPHMTGSYAPIYVSTDRGQTWSLVFNVPSTAGGTLPTGDITMFFSGTTLGTTNTLYTGILHSPAIGALDMSVYRTSDYRTATPMTQLDSRSVNVDQPHVAAGTPLAGNLGQDAVFVGFNNGYSGVHPQSATVDFSTNAAVPVPVFNLQLIESRSTGSANQDGFSQVPTVHLDGTVYVGFYGWRSSSPSTTDIVVVRDDNWALGATPLSALIDPLDAKIGSRVVIGTSIPIGFLGLQRIGSSNISIAIDPRNSSTVYIAWTDLAGGTPTVHVRLSTDRGVHWSTADLISFPSALNPSLAVNSFGKVGLLYQTLTGARWQTRFVRSTNPTATTWDPGLTLANTSSATPARQFHPYLGDYDHVRAVGKNFIGIFSASNYPDTANFYPGVQYQRYVDWGTHQLFVDAAHTIPLSTIAPEWVSIDPFFFEVDETGPGDDFYVRDWIHSLTDGDNGAEPSTDPYFYTASDVWNRRGTLPGSFPNDQPDNEDAGNGPLIIGDNYAFARIRRNAVSTASQTVTAHFLVSNFGVGLPFVDSTSGFLPITFDPDPTVNFAPGNLGLLTRLPIGTSTPPHLPIFALLLRSTVRTIRMSQAAWLAARQDGPLPTCALSTTTIKLNATWVFPPRRPGGRRISQQ